ncbi:MAG: TIGR00303 family protein, partial [Candidatus Thermoplasmatota archaeon]|nr:TIGR00303 family protein [Candidatus Thermoplasmatota archaeon]
MQTNQERKIFLLLAGSTSVSKIPGITAAGATPELSFLTPAVDAEILTEGRPLSMNDPPMTPDGIPTPSIITRACLKVASLWPLVINAGMAHKPGSMFMETGLEPAGNPVNGEALPQLDRAIKTGIEIGKFLSRTFSDLYIAESVPGGTTTAYLVL